MSKSDNFGLSLYRTNRCSMAKQNTFFSHKTATGRGLFPSLLDGDCATPGSVCLMGGTE